MPIETYRYLTDNGAGLCWKATRPALDQPRQEK
jgi:hypothetical protein